MRRLLALISVLLFPSLANALGVVIDDVRSTGESTSLLEVGDRITFDLRFENPENLGMVALGVVVTGYDPDANRVADNGLRFVSGDRSETFFSRIDETGQWRSGLMASRVGPRESTGTVIRGEEESVFAPALHTRAFGAISLTAASGDGSLDVGVDGARVATGDVHLRLTYEAAAVAAVSDLVLEFGPNESYGEIAFAFDSDDRLFQPAFENATWALRIAPSIPEPDAAVLFACGGLVLASAGRSHR